MFESIKKFISYWYFRYLLVTELYMVEKWERIFMHIFFVIVLTLLYYFNVVIVLRSVTFVTDLLLSSISNLSCNDSTHHTIYSNDVTSTSV